MTDESTNEPLEPIDPGAPTPPPPPGSDPVAEAPTVESPVAASTTSTTAPATRRASVQIPVWALAAVGGVLLLLIGFLAGWVLAPGDGDGERAVSQSSNVRQLPFGGGQLDPNGNGRDTDPWSNGNGNGNGQRTSTVYLGVVVENSTNPSGAGVALVAPRSPAASAGLQHGDVITKIDDTAIANASELTKQVRSHQVGDRVSVTYTRGGSSKSVDVKLGRRPALRQLTPPTTRAQF